MRLLTVILHYGNPALAMELARGLHAACGAAGSPHVRIYDNAAPLPCPDAWIRSAHNMYWAGALETCLHHAQREGYTHIWFLNNDIRFLVPPSQDAVCSRVERLEAALGHPLGLWSPATPANPYHPHMQPDPQQPNAFRQVQVLDGIAPLIALDCVHAIGGLDIDNNQRGYGVDVWLSLRAAQHGWPVIVDAAYIVRHRRHASAKCIPGFLDEAAKAEHAYLTQRMGADWRVQLAHTQHTMTPWQTLPRRQY